MTDADLATVSIPRPVQFVLDDVGWREGWDVSSQGGPFRAGVDRLLGPEDYDAVADIGEKLGIRPLCAMILCEWDKENVCAAYPTTTREGRAWDNSGRVGQWADRAARIFVDRAAHVEFGLHGVGHEHWDDGRRTRAEWYGGERNTRWPREVLRGHLECFRRILAQYDLDPAHGMSLPRAFVPCAFAYYWDDADPESTGALMRSAGVRYCSTPFVCCTFAGGSPDRPDGGFDNGLIVLDRGRDAVSWDQFAGRPEPWPTTSICGVHWPNVLAPDPADNGDAIKPWIEYLERIDRRAGWMLGRNMAETCSQWLYHSYATIAARDGGIDLDASGVPAVAWENALAESPIVQFPASQGQHVHLTDCRNCRPVATWTRAGRAYCSIRLLGPSRRCRFRPRLMPHPAEPIVLHDGTYDVLDLELWESSAQLAIRVYGRQEVRLRLPFIPADFVEFPGLTVHSVLHDPATRETLLDVEGGDIQGQSGQVVLSG